MEYFTGQEVCKMLKIYRTTLCIRANKLGIFQKEGNRLKYTAEEVNKIQFFKYRNKKQPQHEFTPAKIENGYFIVESKLNTMEL